MVRKGDGTGLGAEGYSQVRKGDGTVLWNAIPDDEIYLQDDWGDNKLTDRDDSGTTTYNDVEGVYRPKWTTDRSSPTTENQQLVVDDGGALRAEINLNFNETITWMWTNVDLSGLGTGNNDAGLVLFAGSTDLGSVWYNEGYQLQLRDNADMRLFARDGSGSETEIINAGSHTGTVDIGVTRSPSGDWEVFVDGSSQGTGSDSTWTDDQICGFVVRDQNNGNNLTVDEIKVN